MTLKLSETINKALLSTTSRFVGEFEMDDMLLSHAWHGFQDPSGRFRSEDGPASRNAFTFVFETPAILPEVGRALPDYSGVPALLSWYLSVLFGKRFDDHGLTESIGIFRLPTLDAFSTLCRHTLPHNSRRVRADYPVPLDLRELSRIRPLLEDASTSSAYLQAFQTAAKFYAQAIRNFESDPEVSYLHLVTSIEVLSSQTDLSTLHLFDADTKLYLDQIEKELVNGSKVAKHFRAKILGIKRKFVGTVVQLIQDDFFSKSECNQEFGQFKSESFLKSIAAAYDLRSQYVHTGVPFGKWVERGFAGENAEVQVGKPTVANKDYAKVLANAPTFVGLERVVRYCLLRSAENKGFYLQPGSANA